MRGLVLCLLLVAVALSGCVADDAPEPSEPVPSADPPLDGDGSDDAVPLGPPEPLVSTIPVHWNGTLGTFAFGCEYQHTGQCQGQTVKAHDNSLYVEGPGVVRAISLTLTWTTVAPVNDRLVFDVMVMGLCSECNSTNYDHVEGTSPLTITLDGLDVPMTAEHVVHAFAYNGALLLHNPPAFAQLSVEQAISIDGTVTLETPAA